MNKRQKHTAGVCGHFAHGHISREGQTVKTNALYEAMKNKYGSENIMTCDTYDWNKRSLKILLQTIVVSYKCSNIIIMPGKGGLRVLVPLVFILGKMFKTKTHYVVIGGWLSEYLKKHRVTALILNRYNAIYLETVDLQEKIENEYDFHNVYTVPNFKSIQILSDDELPFIRNRPLRLCYFARVMKEKGIEDVINSVVEINTKYKKVIYSLDIYGQIEKSYISEFNLKMSNTPKHIQYMGVVVEDSCTTILKNYYMMIFPTRFATEGVPGTIIDAYSAGLPVLSSRWRSFGKVVEDGVTGFGYELLNNSDLTLKLENCLNTSEVNAMRKNCLIRARNFSPETALEPLFSNIDLMNRAG